MLSSMMRNVTIINTTGRNANEDIPTQFERDCHICNLSTDSLLS